MYKNIIVIVNGLVLRRMIPNNCELVCKKVRLPMGEDDVFATICNIVCEDNPEDYDNIPP